VTTATPEELQRRRLLEAPVPRLVARLAAPTVASMLVGTLYNAGDAWFVSQLGTSPSGAIGIVFALLAVLQAFGFLFGHGAGSNIARRLGAGDIPGARAYAATGFWLSLVFAAVVSAFGLLFLAPLACAFGSTPTILPYACSYLRWILLAGPFFVASYVLNNILRYEGRASRAMLGLLAGSILNLFLDPLFIFVFGWGVSGAGAATAVSQTVSFFLLFAMFRPGIAASRLHPRHLSFRPAVVRSILVTGFPNLLRNALNALGPVILNHQAAVWGDHAIAAMSIVGRLSFLVIAVGVGIGQGMQPVAAFNWGANRPDRVRHALRFTLAAGFAASLLLALPLFLAAPAIVAAFRDDPAVVAIGATALRLQAAVIAFNHPAVCTNMLFQSLGFAFRSSLLSVFRNGLFFIPLIVLLPRLFGLPGLESAQPAADVLSFLASIPFLVHWYRTSPRLPFPSP
jgi:putative MATE family efflux protein